MGVVSFGIGGLLVTHVGRRLLLGRTPRQCAMPRHKAIPRSAEYSSFSACLHAVVSSALEGGYTAAFEGPSKQLYTSFSAFLHALATSALTLNAARASLVHPLALSEFKIFILNFHFIACPCFERP